MGYVTIRTYIPTHVHVYTNLNKVVVRAFNCQLYMTIIIQLCKSKKKTNTHLNILKII